MQLYIDPGTGSMLFTIILGLAGGAFFFVRKLYMQVKFKIMGGKQEAISKKKIPFVIFSDDRRYWKVFKPVCQELLNRGKSIRYLTCSDDDPAFQLDNPLFKCEFLGKGNRAFSKMNYLNAGVVLSTTPSLDVFQWKRSKDVNYYVHMQHAANDITGYRMFGIDYYDAILLSGQYQVDEVRELERMRNLPAKDLEIIGIPYMDQMVDRINQNPDTSSHKRTVLLAPSWGPNSIFNRYGKDIFELLLKGNYHIIVRPHPQSYTSEADLLKTLKQAYPESDRIEWNSDNDHFEVLKRSDILISDFSGIIFDFTLVYDKPLIYADTEFDKSPYDYWWMKEEPWTFRILPKIGIKLDKSNLNEINGLMDKCIDSSEYARARDEARKETWQYMGQGTQRACDFLEKKIDLFSYKSEDSTKEIIGLKNEGLDSVKGDVQCL